MSQLPQDPNNEYTPAQPCTEQSSTPDEPLPTLADDLDFPYALFDPIQINHLPGESHYDFGLGDRQVNPYTKWGFEKWLNWSLFDSFALYFNDWINPVAQDNVFEERDRYELSVIKESVPEGDVIVKGRVKRVSNNESWSLPQTVLIKTTRPGGRDLDPGDGYHSGLVMTIIDFPEGTTLTPENIGAGLTVEITLYENIRRNDLIRVSYDGHFVEHRVSDDEARGLTPIRIFIDRSIVLQGSLKGSVTIRFTVTDVVQNTPDEKYPYSKPYALLSELDPNLIFAPLFFVNRVETKHVDWDTDSEAVFEVLADVERLNPKPNPSHRIHVFLDAKVGKTTKLFALDPVMDTNIGHEYVRVASSIIEQILGGEFRLFFEWRNANGDLLKTSGSHTIVVVGTPIDMPPPEIIPSELGQVDPSKPAIFRVPFYKPFNSSWEESCMLEHLVPGGGVISWVVTLLAGAQGGSVNIPAVELMRFDGRGDTYGYYMTLDGATGEIRKSKKLIIQVGARTADMPQAELEGQIGNNVDPEDVLGDPKLTLPHPDFRAGDEVVWSITGSSLDGSDSGSFTINAGSAGKLPEFTVDRKILDLNNGGSLRIIYALLRPGTPPRRLFSIPLDLTVGAATQLDRPIIKYASQFPDALNPRAALNGTRVIVKYRPMRSTDLIKVTWYTANGFGSVEEYVQGNPATNEVSVDIDSRTIAKCLAEGGQDIQVQYSFFRGAIPFSSEIVHLRLLALTDLPTPRIDDFDGYILDLSRLKPGAHTRVSKWDFSHSEQFMWLRYTGTYANGLSFILDTYDAAQVGTEVEVNGVNVAIPYSDISTLKDGTTLTVEFLVSFAESRAKTTALRFGVRTYTIQSLPSTLPAPEFANLPGATVTINPVDYLHYAFVAVEYTGMNGTHWIDLEWRYPDGSKANILGKNGLDGGRVDFTISSDILTTSLGKTIELRYIVTINGKQSPSYIQSLIVKALTDQQLPSPLINGTPSNSVLDLRQHAGNPQASVARWDFARKNQRVWITCYSEGVDPLPVLSNYPITEIEAGNGLVNKVVSRDWLDLLIVDKIQVICEVTFDGSQDRTTATRFPVVDYIVLNKWIKDFTPFTDNFLNNWVSKWPNTSIHRESNGNAFLRAAPLTGQGVHLSKIFTPIIGGYYRVTFNFRVDREAAIGGPTSIQIKLGTLIAVKKMFEIDRWETYDMTVGPLPGGALTVEISVNNPTTRGIYDFDSIRVQQRPFPA